MQRLHPRTISAFHRSLLRWYRTKRRQLVWRTTRDPYEILVSEIMLQQTQARRVQEKLPQFLKRFPTLQKLARASRADVVRAWRGMGYNNRAVRLRDLARTVLDDCGGRLPSDIETLRLLPGVGNYTAHALMCFAYGKRVPVVDVNIRRVLSRTFWKMKSIEKLRKDEQIWSLAGRILPKDCYSWNQALMDLGATVCTARRPRCEECPVASICSSHHLGKPQATGRNHIPRTKMTEPTYDGIPNRIWRGRIVEALRNVNGEGSLSLFRLGRTIKHGFNKHEAQWLDGLIEGLVRDGIVHMFRKGSTTNVMLDEE